MANELTGFLAAADYPKNREVQAITISGYAGIRHIELGTLNHLLEIWLALNFQTRHDFDWSWISALQLLKSTGG